MTNRKQVYNVLTSPTVLNWLRRTRNCERKLEEQSLQREGDMDTYFMQLDSLGVPVL